MDAKKIRIMLVDDMEGIRDFFSLILSKEPDMEIVATASSGRQAVALYKKDLCDVILMDIEMETRTAGIDAIVSIREIDKNVKIIVNTIHEDDELLFRAYTVGADDFIIKTDSIIEVLNSIRKVSKNHIDLRPQVAEKILGEFKRMRVEQSTLSQVISCVIKLSNSEFEVLKNVYEGKTYAQISRERCVEQATIKKQASNILKKFDSNNMKSIVKVLKKVHFFEEWV